MKLVRVNAILSHPSDDLVITDSSGDVLYLRSDIKKGQKLSFNVPFRPDGYLTNAAMSYLSYGPAIAQKPYIRLPRPDRFSFNGQAPSIVTKNELSGKTPARIYPFPEQNYIEVAPEFWKLPWPYREFIIRHEMGHYFYNSEINADLFALKSCLGAGIPRSQCVGCLIDVLGRDENSVKRIINIFNNVH